MNNKKIAWQSMATMRTYSRKKHENKIIEGVLQLCRLCLGKTDLSVPLFPESSKEDYFCALPLRIMICVGLEITREEYLPNTICLTCFKELERCYIFRKKCEVTYRKLKSHAIAAKEKEFGKVQEHKSAQENVQNMVQDINNKEQEDFHSNFTANIDLPNSNNSLNQITIENECNNEIQDISEAVTNVSPMEIDASNTDMSLILSTILIEIGVIQEQDSDVVRVDENLKYIELEGENSSKIVLELVEEVDEQPTSSNFNHEEPNSTRDCDRALEEEDGMTSAQSLQEKPNKKRKHPAEAVRWECSSCARRLVSRSALLRHQRAHSGERPFVCAVCGRAFTQREVMVRHALVHQERRPHACGRCPKTFTQRGALRAHAAAHAPAHRRALRLHRCPHCDKVFLYASGLSRHIQIHNGKVFQCDECARRFLDKSSLLRHLRRGHAGRPRSGAKQRTQTSVDGADQDQIAGSEVNRAEINCVTAIIRATTDNDVRLSYSTS